VHERIARVRGQVTPQASKGVDAQARESVGEFLKHRFDTSRISEQSHIFCLPENFRKLLLEL